MGTESQCQTEGVCDTSFYSNLQVTIKGETMAASAEEGGGVMQQYASCIYCTWDNAHETKYWEAIDLTGEPHGQREHHDKGGLNFNNAMVIVKGAGTMTNTSM